MVEIRRLNKTKSDIRKKGKKVSCTCKCLPLSQYCLLMLNHRRTVSGTKFQSKYKCKPNQNTNQIHMHLFTVKNVNKTHDKVHKNYANKLERHIAGNFLFSG